jgi:ABC-type branched-subunit amino acid transport system substrate-binding protein
MFKKSRIVVVVAAMAAAGCSSSSHSSTGANGSASTATTPGPAAGNTASAPGVTADTINIGYISTLSGPLASTFANGDKAAKARFDAINASGGINGRKINLIAEDDAGSPTTNVTVSQDLVQNKKVFAVIDFSALTFAGAKYLNQQGVPVTGDEFDGPEWGQQPNTNMFTWGPPLYTQFNGSYYTYDNSATLKSLGVTKLAGVSYNSPSAAQAIKGNFAVAQAAGVSKCYENLSIPFGAVDFTAAALSIKHAGCDAVTSTLVDQGDIALSTALKQAGVTAKQIYATGYDQDVLDNPQSAAALEGAYVTAGIDFTNPNAGTTAMINTLKQNDPSYKSGIPSLGVYGSYISADVIVRGLQTAGQNPTRTSFISGLRGVTDYTAGGIFTPPISFGGFGTVDMLPAQTCGSLLQLVGGKFVETNDGKPVCSNRVAVK